MVPELNEDEFETKVAQADLPVLIDFWAPWCAPCRMVSPLVDELSQELQGRMQTFKINVDDNPRIAQRFGIQSIPTLMLFRQGVPALRIIGYRPKPELRRTLEGGLAAAARQM